ncbi:aminoacyl-tRNA hydrolase [Campylobacter sp. MIT 12-8780]|uniref:aminoacyl-tRNA hydrolase n=1 Tax=unclassified Campylobacter TaxID=2593542 RepID=UPI00115F057A|nr:MULTISPECIES: aminoacyl-tRNA hydrolase [unclassified Campylobacter]NDJ27290.1 aminoacyl-tRNA hydrolase [Campylobacter sp. MIT 19-121]TQR40381.1 aminoacyl-tRNA hydrolase [Campylobacter sp. MIT 12-8780]
MILVVGLGNIGKEYENTRHNVGFMLVDLLLNELETTPISNTKFKGELFKSNSSPLLLLKPHTFMNNSGISVSAVMNFYKCDRLIVIHDDIDLSLGTLRFKKGGSSGGHNGLKSIDSFCGNDYERVRIGIGKDKNVINFVLGHFSADELKSLEPVLTQAKNAVLALINSDITSVASNFSLKKKE